MIQKFLFKEDFDNRGKGLIWLQISQILCRPPSSSRMGSDRDSSNPGSQIEPGEVLVRMAAYTINPSEGKILLVIDPNEVSLND